jgi:hypothetical protein
MSAVLQDLKSTSPERVMLKTIETQHGEGERNGEMNNE